jgi:hypothetical protein
MVLALGVGIVFGGAAFTFGAATEKNEHELKLKTERVIVFKDGYSLIVKRGSAVTDKEGNMYTEQVPDAAVLGSFWAVPDKGKLKSMLASRETTEEKTVKGVPCTETVEILQANRGKSCKVELEKDDVYSGTIQEVLVRKTSDSVPTVLRATLGLPEDTADSEVLSGISGTQFVLRTENGDVLLPIGQVRTLTIHDMKTSLERTVTKKKRPKRLTFRFAEPGKRRDLLVMYFRPGMRWIPTYRIELAGQSEKKLATVTLQAEILNEAEDFVDVPVDIVVGVPNFRFRDTPSPLILEQTLRRSLQEAAPQLMQQFGNNSMISNQRVSQAPRRAASGGGSLELPRELTAAGTQDLFVYNLPEIDFKKGQRSAVHIFTASVPYRDVYTWDLHLQRRDIEAAPSGAGVRSPLVLARNEVWHQLELNNTTDVPWTTGAALIMQGNQPLAQELLTYTSPKMAVRVPVTVSVDTRGTFREEETERKLKALTWDKNTYAKIDKKATLRLQNAKQVPVEAEITFRFGGRFDEISDEGKGTLDAFQKADWRDYRGSAAVNNSSSVRWSTKIQPGEVFAPTVTYHYYARH